MNRHLLPEEIHQLIDGAPGFDTAPLEAHLRECALCRAEWELEQQMVEALGRMPPLMPSAAFADHVTDEVYVHVPWTAAAGDTAEHVVRRMTPRSKATRVMIGAWLLVVLVLANAGALWLLSRLPDAMSRVGLFTLHPMAAIPNPAPAYVIKLTLACFVLAIILGLGVLTFADESLESVTRVLTERPGFSLCCGVIGKLCILPIMVLAVVAVSLTIIGILFVPVVMAAIWIICLGAAGLGAAAVAERTGRWLMRTPTSRQLTPRAIQLRALVIGVAAFGVLWIVFAFFSQSTSTISLAVRGIVIVVNMLALLLGFGAVIAWRLQERRRIRGLYFASPPATVTDVSWETPTPVGGVTAARPTTSPPSAIERG